MKEAAPGRRRIWAVAVCVALLAFPVLFTALPSPSPPAPPTDLVQGPTEDSMHQMGRLLASLPEPLSPTNTLGPAAEWLFPRDAQGMHLGAPPSDITGALDVVRHGVPWESSPIPDPPAGEEPLLSALQAHAETAGFDLPDLGLLRAQITSLRLLPEAEDALAQLVLAYDEATRLEAEAVRDLSPDELLLLDRDPDAVAAWFAEDPERTGTDLEALHQELLARIDFSQRLRAADLLLRTIELVKDPLALPPAPLAVGAHDLAQTPEEAAQDAVDDAASAPAWPDTGDPDWDKVYTLIGLGIDPAHLSLPDLPEESLAEALTNLATTLGVPADDLPLDGLDALPASLADAVATIVTARHVGLNSGDATLHTLLLMEATREARPALEAWAAVLRLGEPDLPDAAGLLEVALSPDPQPSRILAQGWGLEPSILLEPPALATLLEREGLSPEDALAAAASLPAPVALGTAHALHGMQQADAQREQILSRLDPAARDILVHQAGAATALLEAPSWSHEEAALVEAWARGMATLGPDGLRALRQSQLDLVASVEAAVAVLGPYAAAVAAGEIDVGLPTSLPGPDTAPEPLPWYRRALSLLDHIPIIGTASAQPPLDCPTAIDGVLADCKDDVWFYLETDGSLGTGILITGFYGTDVDSSVISRNPGLMIDLGGGDTYRHPVGSGEGLSSRVAIDLGGNDVYDNDGFSSPMAHGAASDLGTVGLLWDVGGADNYIHACDGDDCGAQGYGTGGGLGILLDGGGDDEYEAKSKGTLAHGVGLDGGMGLLLDLGNGKDTLHAAGGQGYASGTGGGLGLLLNDGKGANRYDTNVGNPRFQGGHRGAAVGILIDLGGEGTIYKSLNIPDKAQYLSFEAEPRERKDDALWIDRDGGLGIGIDSTLDDEDGDEIPNLVELLVGSGTDPVAILGGLLEGGAPDPGSLVAESQRFGGELLCDPDPPSGVREPGTCPALLHIGSAAGDTITEPAHILIELDGDDTYEAEVAGPGSFWASAVMLEGTSLASFNGASTPSLKHRGVGSFALDLSGADTYLTPPDGGQTQGAVNVTGALPGGLPVTTADGSNQLTSASLLLDAQGNDTYEAGEWSQGAALSLDECGVKNNPGEAWLVDLDGDDVYNGADRSQGHISNRAGRAGLVDLRGSDNYSFVQQAVATDEISGLVDDKCNSSRDAPAAAIMYDGGGKDSYHSKHPLGLNPTEDLFFPLQGWGPIIGRISVGITFQNGMVDRGQGMFLDQGTEYDWYTVDTGASLLDVSHIKNNQTRYGGKDIDQEIPSPQTHNAAIFIDGPAWFANHGDTDGDGAPTAAEFVGGSDVNDPGDNLGALWGSLGRLDALAADPQGAAGHLGLDGPEHALRIPGRLIIGGRGDSIYRESIPFFVSLGGNNTYNSPNLGGSWEFKGPQGSITNTYPTYPYQSEIEKSRPVSLLLDVGSGNTSYLPNPDSCSATDSDDYDDASHNPLPIYLCPSLGAASNAIAIVADGGGVNRFHTVGTVDMETTGTWTVNLLTQGAATNGGVGALVTWNASNEFQADLVARMERSLDAPPVTLTLRGVAQGAADSGLGLLATFGGRNDTYELNLTHVPTSTVDPGTLIGLSQGATTASYGLLIDDGGKNQFIAPAGYSQGYAETEMGLLWSGTGDDRYVAQQRSQGSAQAQSAFGILYDAGGNDEYLVLPLEGVPSYSQGASSGGTALLIDVAGDDRYMAAQSTHAQGVGVGGGSGMLLDGGGHDQYHARGPAQAYAQGGTDVGLLIDLHGRDQYRLDGSDGMGSGAGCALFLDAAGTDAHAGGPSGAGDDARWTQGTCATGIDSNALDSALSSLYSSTSQSVWVEVEFNGQVLDPNDDNIVSGDLLLRADVTINPSDADRIRRVSFLANGEVVGHGTLTSSPTASTLEYEFLWDTTTDDFPEPYPDGGYKIHASVFLDTGADAGAVGPPDLPAMESGAFDVTIDNPPLVKANLQFDNPKLKKLKADLGGAVVSPNITGDSVPLVVEIGRDKEWPSSVDPVELCSDLGLVDCHAGASIRLNRIDSDDASSLDDLGYYPAGKHTLAINGSDDEGGAWKVWQDGWYNLTVEAEDVSGDLVNVTLPDSLLVDGTPPTSSITTPEFAGEAFDANGGGLSLRFQHSDGDGSGINKTCIYWWFPGEDENPDPDTVSRQCLTPNQPFPRIDGVDTDSVLYVLTTTEDKAGNLETDCNEGERDRLDLISEELLCYEKKGEGTKIEADFDKPGFEFGTLRVNGLEPSDAYVRPGVPVNFTVQATDVGLGLDRVEITLPGGHKADMETANGLTYWYNEWHEHNGDLPTNREDPLIVVVNAWDKALNRATEQQTATLDSRSPVVLPQETRYMQIDGTTEKTLLAGRPSIDSLVFADARARIADAALDSLALDVSTMTGVEDDLRPCPANGPVSDPEMKTCRVKIPQGVEDGDYEVWFHAIDRAGNQNTTERALIQIRSTPLDLENITLASVGHDRFRVEWTTNFEGTSSIHYGLTSEFGQVAAMNGPPRKEHSVEVTGLAPSSTYAFQIVSENTGGIPSKSATVTVTTLNAYTFDLADLPKIPLRGVVDVGYHVGFLEGDSPVRGTLLVQDAQGVASPFEVTTVQMDEGDGAILFDTTKFADGAYRFVFELDRAGDFLRNGSSVFRIDNTEPLVLPVSPRPASTVAEADPEFEAVLLDSLGREPPDLHTLRVLVDGQEFDAKVILDDVLGPSSIQRRIVFTLPDALAPGPHQIDVSVADRAGNVGHAEWPLLVDTTTPTLNGTIEVTPLPGPDLAKPGGRLHVAARLQDESQVAAAWIDLSVLNGGKAVLLSTGEDWSATAEVPLDAPHGTFEVPVVAVDALGNQGVVGNAEVTVDAHPPQITGTSPSGVEYTAVNVAVTTDKPTRAWAGEGPAPTAGTWQTTHVLRVEGLAPGLEHALHLNAVDQAGHHVARILNVTTTDDPTPPTAVGNLSWSSPSEGVVALAWAPATDNAGIQHYRLERSQAPRALALESDLAHNATTFRDGEAPAGRSVTYRVTPIDVAGLEGPAAEVAVDVLALPHLSDASVSPMRGSSRDPFTFQVEYRHAGDRAADSLTVQAGDQTYPLARVDESDPCHDGCLYQARVHLPPSSLFESAEEANFRAMADGQQGLLATEMPFVVRGSGDGGVIDLAADGRAAPGPGILVLFLLLAASAITFRRRNLP